MTPLVLVVIVGPQASGKSTIATALSHELRRRGESVAVVELDAIAAMALPTLPGWSVAQAIFASVTGQWARTDLTCVVAEGSGSEEEVSRLLDQAPDDGATLTVAVTASFTTAYARAMQDPSRGVSREHGFLSGVYDRWPAELDRIRPDVVVDSDALSVERSVDLISRAIDSARAALGTAR